MPVEPVAALNDLLTAVVIVILLVGIYRAGEMRRAFVNRVYRSRATWYILLMVTIIGVNLTNFYPIPQTGTVALLGFLPFLALIVVIFAFVDRSVLVAIQADFFHRNTLRWLSVRWGTLALLVASMLFGGIVFTAPSGSFIASNDVIQVVGFTAFLIVLPGVLSYATAALIVAARRTSDHTLKRSIFLMGLALSTLVISIILETPFSTGSLPYVIVNDGTSVVGIYLIYRSVMSFSPLARIEKDTTVGVAPAFGKVT